MEIKDAIITKDGIGIVAVIDGVSVTIPKVDSNRYYQEILRQVEFHNLIVQDYQDPEPTKNELKNYLENKRWQVETGGITYNGLIIPTDDRAKILIEGAAATLSDSDEAKFKAGSNWIDINGETIRLLLLAITQHVQACFAKEAELFGLIEDEEIANFSEIDNANWPTT